MTKEQKSRNLYKTPFSRAYWHDAAMEMKDTRMLVFAALMIALRVALKLVYIPLAPNLKINTAFIANAMGAMVFGPVVSIVAAVASDLLGVLISGETYFLPFVLTEIAGSLIFALFLYRVKLTPTRVMLSRFCICLFVNILLQTPLMMLYYQIMMGGKMYVLTVPHILKNLFMFPIESVVLTLLLSVVQPITYRMGLTYNSETMLSFTKKQIALLLVLVVVGIGCVFGYLFYHYDHTSLSSGYDTEERAEKNHYVQTVILDKSDEWDDVETVTVVESAYKEFMGKEVTYTVAIYQVAEGAEVTDKMWAYSKTPASKDENLTKVATATFVVNEKTGEVLSFDTREVS